MSVANFQEKKCEFLSVILSYSHLLTVSLCCLDPFLPYTVSSHVMLPYFQSTPHFKMICFLLFKFKLGSIAIWLQEFMPVRMTLEPISFFCRGVCNFKRGSIHPNTRILSSNFMEKKKNQDFLYLFVVSFLPESFQHLSGGWPLGAAFLSCPGSPRAAVSPPHTETAHSLEDPCLLICFLCC